MNPSSLATALGVAHLVRVHLVVFGVGLLLAAASLQWEPEEWESPIFGIVFTWLSPQWWAIVLVLLALLKLLALVLAPRLVAPAIVAGNMLFAIWCVSFIVAYFDQSISPASPMLALLCGFVVGEHIAVASLLQRDGKKAGGE